MAVYLAAYLAAYLPAYLAAYLATYLAAYLAAYLAVYLTAYSADGDAGIDQGSAALEADALPLGQPGGPRAKTAQVYANTDSGDQFLLDSWPVPVLRLSNDQSPC